MVHQRSKISGTVKSLDKILEETYGPLSKPIQEVLKRVTDYKNLDSIIRNKNIDGIRRMLDIAFKTYVTGELVIGSGYNSIFDLRDHKYPHPRTIIHFKALFGLVKKLLVDLGYALMIEGYQESLIQRLQGSFSARQETVRVRDRIITFTYDLKYAYDTFEALDIREYPMLQEEGARKIVSKLIREITKKRLNIGKLKGTTTRLFNYIKEKYGNCENFWKIKTNVEKYVMFLEGFAEMYHLIVHGKSGEKNIETLKSFERFVDEYRW